MLASQLEQFCRLFRRESDLQDALLELLGRLAGVAGVRRLQGPGERGKDLVFYHHSPFGTRRLIACVVKNTPITGSVARASGARTVLYQSQQAFDTPYTNPSGQEERVEHVYVMSPHPCSPDAIESVKGALASRSGQVTFLCGNDLLDVFKANWPSFLDFEGDFLGRYLNDLRLQLDADPNLSALILRHSIIAPANRLLSAVYVPQELKVQLAEFKERPLSWYPELFRGKVTLADVEGAALNLGVLVGILAYARVWSRASREILAAWTHAARILQRVAQELPRLWDDAYRAFCGGRATDDLLERAAVGLWLLVDDLVKDQYASALGIARHCWEAFQQRLREAVGLARRFPADPLAVLVHPDYPPYCAAAEAAGRSPLAIRKTAVIREEKIPSRRLADLRTHLLITAPVGLGKTSLCKHHALHDAQRLLAGQGDALPVYVPLHQVANLACETFHELFLRTECLCQALQSEAPDNPPFRRVRLYLDGLDEIASPERRRLVVRVALSPPLAWPVQVIVTARDHVYDDYLAQLPRVQLSTLDRAGVDQLVRRWLDTDPEGVADVQSQLQRQPSLGELMAVPLLGTLIIGVYRRIRRLPETRVALYEMFVDLLCGGWDLVRNVQRESRFRPSVKMTVLQKLAGQLHTRRLRYARPADVQTALASSLDRLEDQYDAFLQEVLQDGLLSRSGGVFLFSHLSFQEFFAAKDLSDPGGRAQRAALRRFLLGEDWWREVLAFYIGLVNDPYTVHEWIRSVAGGVLRSARLGEAEVRQRCGILEGVIRTTYPDYHGPTRSW